MNKRTFIKSIGLSALIPMVGCQNRLFSASSVQKPEDPLLPKPLNRGDLVGLVSPSAATNEEILFQFAEETLLALGLKVLKGQHLEGRRGHLAGTDEERAADLNHMFATPEVKAIICIRGGSGAARILPLLDYESIKSNPKPILGYSDITALHNGIYAQTKLITFHGPNGTGSWNSFNVGQFENLFFNQQLMRYENEQIPNDDLIIKKNRIQTIRPGIAEGTIVGGNLTVLTALAGSPYLPDFTNKILFLEDVGEEPYRIDRMMSTLKLMGALDKIKGFIFGQCSDCTPSNGYGSLTVWQILQDYIKPLEIPAYYGAMIGHISKQFIIPIGAHIKMDADKGVFEMTHSVFQKG
ncbi:LD-carboxypeptidase [Echinicola jeungdonensis]|uniref:LD-carboxypeptidase n=1 Tax=Echinicola jeungdonensis TaxID=709343 RepID=A0ABV5J872_9BACT|nr:LD-carboxypeptidase [Echinicola jeungdonensis]MDN3669904.1 LD-carboxypeptidase [Echinicola jeungdonensis]